MKFQDVFFLYCLDIKEVIAALVGTPVESVDSNNATLTLESVSSYNILKRWHLVLNLLLLWIISCLLI